MNDHEATAKRLLEISLGCTSPLPLRCRTCSKLNAGVGLDFCLFHNFIATEVANLKAERDAEVERLKTIIHNHTVSSTNEFAFLRAKLAAEFVRGLERARVIADEIEFMTMDYGIETAIQAEIDKAGK